MLRSCRISPKHADQGQGAAQANEAGAPLGAIFSLSLWQNYNHTSVENPTLPMITEGLALFETVRKGRASVMQIFSSVGQDEAALIYDKAKEYVGNGQEVPRTQVVCVLTVLS